MYVVKQKNEYNKMKDEDGYFYLNEEGNKVRDGDEE